jgi:uncharacterized protein (TIGR04255 family)
MSRAAEFQFDLEKEFPNLPAAPIVEAVIHWRARATVPWQPDTLKNELAARLPEYDECEPQRLLHVHAEIDAEGSKTQMGRDSFVGLRLTSANSLQIAQFNRNGLVFSRLKPYVEWESFSVEGLRLWRIFLDLARPSEVERLGVRFINQIPLKQITDVGKVMAKPPKCLDSLGLPLSSFFHQSTYEVPQQPYGINVTQTIQPPTLPDNKEFQLILDIDTFTKEPFEGEGIVLQQHLLKMRLLKDEAFFSLLRPKAIKAFEKE